MKISITRHAIKRAKQRFNLNKNSLIRMINKAIKQSKPIKSQDYDSISYTYSYFNFIFRQTEDSLILLTVTNLSSNTDYKESLLTDCYYKGKKIGKHILKESYESI